VEFEKIFKNLSLNLIFELLPAPRNFIKKMVAQKTFVFIFKPQLYLQQ
jgi:hypothetical protein